MIGSLTRSDSQTLRKMTMANTTILTPLQIKLYLFFFHFW